MNSLLFEVLVYLCEAVTVGSLYLNLLKPRFKVPWILLPWAGAIAVGVAVAPSFSVLRMAVIALLEFAVVLFVFEDRFSRKLRCFLFVEAVSAAGCLLSYLLIGLHTKEWRPILGICSGEDCTYLLLYLALLSILASTVFRLAKKALGAELPWVLGTQLVIGVGECAAILAFTDFGGGVIPLSRSALPIVSVFCLVAANLSVGILSSFLIRRFTLTRSMDFGKELSDMEYRYYEMSVENDRKLRALKHDISNQIQTVYSLLVNGESRKSIEMMEELRASYGHVEPLLYCENPVLNIILANKRSAAEKQGIEVQIRVRDFPQDLPISDFDLSTVVCNLLDNAIRGCVCSNQTRPRLVVEIVRKGNYLVIRILNSCIVNLTVESTDRIETTKSNSQTHGFGMPIIARIVKRYRGDFVVSAQNGLFTATAIMSVK